MSRLGFQDDWRLWPNRAVKTPVIQRSHGFTPVELARFSRIVHHRPQAFLRASGTPSTPKNISRHLRYISRDGELPLEGPDQSEFVGRDAIRELTADWTFLAEDESGRRSNMPLTRAYVLGAPPGADYEATERATRAFATWMCGDRFDYVFAMHGDRPHPHAHVLVRALGAEGERFRLGKNGPQRMREAFAQHLRKEGVPVQANLQWERGVWTTRESFALRKMRERHAQGGRKPEAHMAADRLARFVGQHGDPPLTAAEERRLQRARMMKAYYIKAASLLRASLDPDERLLGDQLRDFAQSMADLTPPRIAQARTLYQVAELRAQIDRMRSNDRHGDRGLER